MIDIISQADDKAKFPNISYGVSRFEYVWEKLIDYVYGVDNKKEFFPHGHYKILNNGVVVESTALEPDTIMKVGKRVYIIDAKYYKYGVFPYPAYLPATASIHKQITYGEYVFTQGLANENDIYNAFVIPFESVDDQYYKVVSVATGDWVDYNCNTVNYKYVLVVLLDTKYLMDTYARHSYKHIDEMVKVIERGLSIVRA